MASKGGEIVYKLTADARDLARGLNTAENSMKKAQMSTRMMGISIQRAGSAVAKGAKAIGVGLAGMSLSIIGAGYGLVKVASDWEDSFVDVKKVLDPTKTDIDKLEQGIFDLSKTIPLATTEIAEVAASAGRLGIEGEKDILKFTEVMAAMGVATDLSAEEAGDALARFANVMEMPISEVDRLGSAIVNLGNNLPTTEREIVKMGTRMASAGRRAGLSEAEIMSFAGAISSTGISAERGGTNMSAFLQAITEASINGGDGLDSLAKVSGMTSDQFRKSFEDDASGAIVTFLTGLNQMTKDGKSTAFVFEDLGINGRLMHELLGNLSGNVKLVTDALKYGNDGWKENKALMEEAEQRYETFSSKVQLLRNRFFYLGTLLGGEIRRAFMGLLEALFPIMDALEKLVLWFVNLSEPVKNAVIYFGAFVAVVLGVGAVLAFIVAGIASVIALFGLFLAGASAVGLSLGGLIGVALGVVVAITSIIGIVTGAIGVFALMIARSENMRNAIGDAFEAIKVRVDIAIGFIKSIAENVWWQIKNFWENDLKEIVQRVEELLQPIFDKIAEFGTAEGLMEFSVKAKEMSDKVKSAFEFMLEHISFGMNLMLDIIEASMPFLELIYETFMHVFNGAKDIVMQAFGVIQEITVTVLGHITKFWNEHGETIMEYTTILFQILVATFKTTFDTIKNIITIVFDYIVPFIKGALDVIMGIVNLVMSMINKDWSGAWDAIKQILSGAWEIIKSVVMASFEIVKTIFSYGLNFMKNFAGSSWEHIRSIFSSVLAWIASWVKTKFDEIKLFMSNAMTIAKGLVTSIISSLRAKVVEYILMLVDKVVEYFNKIKDKMSEITENAKTAVVEKVVELATDFIEKIRGIVDDILGLGGDFLEAGKNIVSSIGDGILGAFDLVTKPIADLAEKIRGYFPFSPAKEGALTDINRVDFGGTIGDAVRNTEAEAISALQGMTDNMKMVILTFLGNLGNDFAKGFKAVNEVVRKAMTSMAQDIDRAFKLIATTIATSLGKLGNTVSKAFAGIGKSITIAMKAVVTSIKSAFSTINNIVAQSVSKMGQSIQTAFKRIVSTTNSAMKTMASNINSSMKSVGNGISSAFKGINATVKSSVAQMAQSINTSFKTIVSNTTASMRSMGTGISSAFKGINSVVKSATNAMLQALTGAFKSINSMTKSSLSNMRTTVTTSMTGIRTVMNTSWKSIANSTKSIVSSMVSNITNRLRAFAVSVRNSFNAVRTAIVAGMNVALMAVTSRMNSFYNAGRNIGNSVARGIRASTGSVRSASSAMATTVRNFLPFSPAKEGALKDIMKVRIGESVAEAIRKGSPSAIGAMAKMAEGMEENLAIDTDRVKKSIQGAMLGHGSRIKVAYDVPTGFDSDLRGTMSKEVSVKSEKDEQIVEELRNIRRELASQKDKIVKLDGKIVGKEVSDTVDEETSNRSARRKKAWGG